MPLKYACFISYRGYEDNDLMEAMVGGLYKSLKAELDISVGRDRVYRDTRGGMAPGSLLPATLARDICESACMVVVYGPDYFSRDSTWCAREFRAMLKLEASRLAALPVAERTDGFLIIIVFRGKESLPSIFTQNRLVDYFDKYALFQPEIDKHPDLYPKIMRIADYIASRYRRLNQLNPDPCVGCPTFPLPSEDEALAWLDEIENASGTTIQQEPGDAFPR
jgi:hypothetical protein